MHKINYTPLLTQSNYYEKLIDWKLDLGCCESIKYKYDRVLII